MSRVRSYNGPAQIIDYGGRARSSLLSPNRSAIVAVRSFSHFLRTVSTFLTRSLAFPPLLFRFSSFFFFVRRAKRPSLLRRFYARGSRWTLGRSRARIFGLERALNARLEKNRPPGDYPSRIGGFALVIVRRTNFHCARVTRKIFRGHKYFDGTHCSPRL